MKNILNLKRNIEEYQRTIVKPEQENLGKKHNNNPNPIKHTIY